MHEDWLALPPELGARRFGPLTGPVSLGTDPDRNHLVLARRTGLPPVALQLHQGAGGGWSVAFNEQETWSCQVLRAESPNAPPRPLRPGARLAIGDTLILHARESVPLTLLRAPPGGLPAPEGPLDHALLPSPEHGAGKAAPRPNGPPRAGMVAPEASPWLAEAGRQASSAVLARSGTARWFDQQLRWLTQGGWKSPYFLVGASLTVLASASATTSLVAWLLWQAWR